jgi:hypothetical protein
MKVEPQKEHQWLQKFVGDWTFENEAVMGPDQPPVKFSGTESVRSLGGLWIIGEGKGEMPGGGPGEMIVTLGYDPAKKRFVGTFVASMVTNLWVYEGELDEAGKLLTLNTEGPGMSGDGKMTKYQDIYEFINDDHRQLRSQMQGDDGKWIQFMKADYYRKK